MLVGPFHVRSLALVVLSSAIGVLLAPLFMAGANAEPVIAHAQSPASAPRWVAELSGGEAVPPNDSPAVGTFTAAPNGSVVEYHLSVPEIERATAATLQLDAASGLGEFVAFVFRPAEPAVEGFFEREGALDGEYDVVSALDVSAEVTAVEDCGFHCWGQLGGSLRADMAGFVAALDAGRVYVVVKTKAYPEGEIRGRIMLQDSAGDADGARAALTGPDGAGISWWVWVLVALAAALVAGLGAVGVARRRMERGSG